jgi:20S proteasome alpha/beta subunit
MTLAAAFRAPKGGILLCSDLEWNDAGVSKRSINKNYRIDNLAPCEFFISGSGPESTVIKAWDEIYTNLWEASNNGRDVLAEHRELLTASLSTVFTQYAETLTLWPMSLLIVVAPHTTGHVPMLYRTEGNVLIPEAYYYAVGAGKPVADYLADRLYEPGKLSKRELTTLAAFILREAGDSSVGVGMGANMVFIHEGEKVMHFISPGVVREMQDGIPSLSDAIHSYWPAHVNLPEWMAH